jgi:hypothetical protein
MFRPCAKRQVNDLVQFFTPRSCRSAHGHAFHNRQDESSELGRIQIRRHFSVKLRAFQALSKRGLASNAARRQFPLDGISGFAARKRAAHE